MVGTIGISKPALLQSSVAQGPQYPLTEEYALHDVGIPNMISGTFLNEGALGSLGAGLCHKL